MQPEEWPVDVKITAKKKEVPVIIFISTFEILLNPQWCLQIAVNSSRVSTLSAFTVLLLPISFQWFKDYTLTHNLESHSYRRYLLNIEYCSSTGLHEGPPCREAPEQFLVVYFSLENLHSSLEELDMRGIYTVQTLQIGEQRMSIKTDEERLKKRSSPHRKIKRNL